MTAPDPPRLAERFLRRCLRNDPAGPAILGDLREDHARVHRARGRGPARRWYAREALLLALPRLAGATRTLFAGDATMHDLSARALREDAAYAWRTLRRSPGFALFTALIVGLGVGATTSVFSVLRPLMFAPLPFEEPEALVWVANAADPDATSLSAVTSRTSNLRDFREMNRSFEGLTGYNAFFNQGTYTLTGAGDPEQLVGAGVARDFLDVLGVPPMLGRNFTPEEGVWDGRPAVILTHGYWMRRFAGDRGVVGRSLTLDDVPREVVGVLPPTFDFTSVFTPGVRVDFLLPFPIADETDQWGNTLSMVGRLRPGVTPAMAQEDLDGIVAQLEARQPDRWGLGADVTPLRDHIAGPFRSALLLLGFASGAVLLIVCVNVSNMLLARAPGRARELAVRKALGASRTRLVRQLLLETTGIALVGGAVGGALAWVVTDVVSTTAAISIPLLDRVRLDGPALLFAVAVAAVAGLVVSVVPALQVAEGGEAAVLRSSGRGQSSTRGARRLREALVVAEVTMACILLVVTGLMLRSFQAVLDVELGFEPANTVVWQLNPSRDFEGTPDATAFYREVTSAAAALPGVERVGLVDASPLGRNRTWGMWVVGMPEEEGVGLFSLFPHIVDAGYLGSMDIAVLEGRGFTPDDDATSAPVVLINESGARRAFRGEDPVGRFIRAGGTDADLEIVGVVEDVRHLSPELEPGIEVYFPMAQMWPQGSMDLVVRSGLPAEQMARAVAAALEQVDPAMPTRDFWTMEGTLDRSVSARRFTLGILGAFAASALLLAGLGIYGVLAYSVSERSAEIGIRMALGASSGDVVRSVIGRTVLLAGLGIATGTVLSVWATRVLSSLLFGVSRADPVTFLAMALVLMGVATSAGAVPALRASRNEGVRALRAE